MQRHPWQKRAREAGLSQTQLARLLGVSDNAVSDGLRGKHGAVPAYLAAAILAWEIMTPEQRDQWVAAVEAFRQGAGSGPG
jgi:predicted transcriptional regulator